MKTFINFDVKVLRFHIDKLNVLSQYFPVYFLFLFVINWPVLGISIPISYAKRPPFNAFMSNGISHHIQMEQSISVLCDVGWYFFHFYSNFNRTYCKQKVETLTRHRVLRRLIGVCTICLGPTKRMLGLYGLNAQSKKRAKIRNRYNQAPHLTQDTNGKVSTSQSDITNEPFPSRWPQRINKQACTQGQK